MENETEAEADDPGEAQDRTETQRTQKRKCCPTGLYKVIVAQGCGFQIVTAASIITTSIMSRSILIIITPLVCLAGDPDLAARLARPKAQKWQLTKSRALNPGLLASFSRAVSSGLYGVGTLEQY